MDNTEPTFSTLIASDPTTSLRCNCGSADPSCTCEIVNGACVLVCYKSSASGSTDGELLMSMPEDEATSCQEPGITTPC